MIADYPGLQAHLETMLNVPGIARTVDLDHIKAGYYSLKALNPSGIVPAGPYKIEQLIKAARRCV